MVFTSVSLQSVRAHAAFKAVLSPRVTLIIGPNASGKTSVIEAIHIAVQGSSFKGSDSEILRETTSWYRIDLTDDDGEKRVVKFDNRKTSGKKQFEVKEKTSYRLTHRNKHPVVLFEPDDLRLLSGSPARRRQFLDSFIAQLDPKYSGILRRYERALKQRNTLLKRGRASRDTLFAWNVALSEYGSYIITARCRFIDRINLHLSAAYRQVASSEDTVTVTYSHPPSSDQQQHGLLSALEAATERDTLLGYTSIGPHRHDVLFWFNQKPALSVASRGEVRSIILGIKTLEADIIEELTGVAPLVLLDDVFSELDAYRQEKLLSLYGERQVIVTSTTAPEVADTSTVVVLDSLLQ